MTDSATSSIDVSLTFRWSTLLMPCTLSSDILSWFNALARGLGSPFNDLIHNSIGIHGTPRYFTRLARLHRYSITRALEAGAFRLFRLCNSFNDKVPRPILELRAQRTAAPPWASKRQENHRGASLFQSTTWNQGPARKTQGEDSACVEKGREQTMLVDAREKEVFPRGVRWEARRSVYCYKQISPADWGQGSREP